MASSKCVVCLTINRTHKAGGETATTQMGDNDNGHNRSTEADTPNPPARTFALATNDPGNPWRAIARALGPKFPDPGEGTGESRLEVVETDLPILASRVARLRFAGDGKHWASAAMADHAFGVDAVAQCSAGIMSMASFIYGTSSKQAHKVPDVDCTCGFYATPLGKAPYSYDRHYVNLLVELSGDVIECELLYRAGHQRVVECQLPRCVYCGKPSNIISAEYGHMTDAACHRRHLTHTSKTHKHLDVDELASLLPVPVTTMEPHG